MDSSSLLDRQNTGPQGKKKVEESLKYCLLSRGKGSLNNSKSIFRKARKHQEHHSPSMAKAPWIFWSRIPLIRLFMGGTCPGYFDFSRKIWLKNECGSHLTNTCLLVYELTRKTEQDYKYWLKQQKIFLSPLISKSQFFSLHNSV